MQLEDQSALTLLPIDKEIHLEDGTNNIDIASTTKPNTFICMCQPALTLLPLQKDTHLEDGPISLVLASNTQRNTSRRWHKQAT